MMKKLLLTLTAAGMLAVPAGIALAQDDDPVPTGPVATCEDHVRTQDRDRSNGQDPAAAHGQERTQRQLQLHEGDCTGDCTGPQARETDQVRTHDETGGQAQNRLGEMGRNGNGNGSQNG